MNFRIAMQKVSQIIGGFLILVGVIVVFNFIIITINKALQGDEILTQGGGIVTQLGGEKGQSLWEFLGISKNNTTSTQEDLEEIEEPTLDSSEEFLPVMEDPYKNIDKNRKVVYPADYYPYSDAIESNN